MPTLAPKSKKSARRVSVKKAAPRRLPATMEISPLTGLPVVTARPGQKPVTHAMVKAALADFP
jgi:hypothetical protein